MKLSNVACYAAKTPTYFPTEAGQYDSAYCIGTIYISLLAYFPFFYHFYLVNLIPVGSFRELIDLFCERFMENWNQYMCGLVLNFHGCQFVLSYGVVISKYELNFSFRLLLDSCSKSCMDQYPLIHLKW
jgi:hypothetical protein